jgi:hypothetical protein
MSNNIQAKGVVITGATKKTSQFSVAIDEVKPQDEAEKVYRADIADNWDNLYKKPGYNSF